MASRFIRIEIVHASDDSSVTKLSAYIARDQRYGVTGLRFDFTDRRDELVAHGLIIPKDAPDWAAVPEKLWREAERNERTWDRKAKCERWKKDAQIAKHIVVALPRELTDADHRELLLEFISKEFRPREHCVAIEWAIHKDNNNPHAHILISMRALGPNGFGNKVRAMNPEAWRAGLPINERDWDTVWADFQREFIRKRYGVAAAETVRERAHVRRPRFARADPDREEKTRKFAEADRIIRNAQRLNPLVALRELTRHRAVFDVEDLRRYCASLKLPDDERLPFIHSVLGHVQCVELFDRSGELVGWTSAEVRSMEEAVLRRAISWTQRRTFTFSWERAMARVVERQFQLSEEQSRALVELVGSRLSLLRGRAGTGKSTVMGAARETLERCGWKVMALAPTNTVVSDLRKSGFKNARTIHSALAKLQRGTLKWDSQTVIVVDEAGMIDTKLMRRLFAAVERTGARLVLAGDDRQFASVQAGGMFAEFVRCCGGPELKTVYRQQKKWQAEASEDLAAGDIAKALESYYAAGRIVFVHSLEEARARAAADGADFVYASTNAEVEALNLAIQARRRAGRVPEDAVDVQTCRGNFSIASGERMQFYATDQEIGCATSEFGTVVFVSRLNIRVRKDDGSVIEFDPRRFDGWGLGYAGTAYKGQGKTQDRVSAVYDNPLAWDPRAAYVTGTRHRDDFKMYVPRNLAVNLDVLIAQITRPRPDTGASTRYRTREQLNPEVAPNREAGPAFDATDRRITDECRRQRRRLWAEWHLWKHERIHAGDTRDWSAAWYEANDRIEQRITELRARLEFESRRPFQQAKARSRSRGPRHTAAEAGPGVG